MSSLQRDPEGFEKKALHKFAGFSNQRVLEVGCGEGRLTWKYAGVSGLTIGFDVDHDALRVAQAEAPAAVQGRVFFAQAEARHIPFVNESFDVAILAWSL